jgi:hypothetical protein
MQQLSIFIGTQVDMHTLFANKSSAWILLFSAITIVWWFSIWTLVDDTLRMIAGGKRHIHLALCAVLIAAISIGFYGYPELLDKM